MPITTLIVRPPDCKLVRVLEADGPRIKGVQRGEGCYYLETSNAPRCDAISLVAPESDFFLKDWGDPHWEIYQMNDGIVHMHACRPTEAEVIAGETLGDLGSVIVLRVIYRHSIADARWLARKLCNCDPVKGITIHPLVLTGIARIETDIPIQLLSRHADPRDPRIHDIPPGCAIARSARRRKTCICKKPKPPGCIVCWHCFKHREDVVPFKTFRGTYVQWIKLLPSKQKP